MKVEPFPPGVVETYDLAFDGTVSLASSVRFLDIGQPPVYKTIAVLGGRFALSRLNDRQVAPQCFDKMNNIESCLCYSIFRHHHHHHQHRRRHRHHRHRHHHQHHHSHRHHHRHRYHHHHHHDHHHHHHHYIIVIDIIGITMIIIIIIIIIRIIIIIINITIVIIIITIIIVVILLLLLLLLPSSIKCVPYITDNDDIFSKVRTLLTAAVRKRLMAERRIGCLLSGAVRKAGRIDLYQNCTSSKVRETFQSYKYLSQWPFAVYYFSRRWSDFRKTLTCGNYIYNSFTYSATGTELCWFRTPLYVAAVCDCTGSSPTSIFRQSLHVDAGLS